MLDPKDLIEYIVAYACDRGTRLTELRLVKFLYLADLYFARDTGKTATGWPWYFHFFGPYCLESISTIRESAKSRLIDAQSFSSHFDPENDYVIFSCRVSSERMKQLDRILPVRVQSALNAAIKRLGDSTPALLNHVYFETEPMIGCTPGQNLDFSVAHWQAPKGEESSLKSFSKTEMSKARELVQKLAKKNLLAASSRTPELYDEHYRDAVEFLNSDEVSETSEISGIADVSSLFKRKSG